MVLEAKGKDVVPPGKAKLNVEKIYRSYEMERLLKYVSIGGGGGFALLGIMLSALVSPVAGVSLIMFALFIGIVPYTTWTFLQFNKFKKMEEHFPTFMRDLSEAKKSGMTFSQSIDMLSKSDYGALTPEIKRAANQLSWGLPFPKVIMRFADRIRGSKIMRQSMTIIIEAFNSGGDIAETMDSVAMNIGTVRDVDAEKKSIMGQQVFIMYFIFFLFLGIIVALYKLMIPMLSLGGTAGAGGLGGMFGMGGGATDYCLSVQWLCSIGQGMGLGVGPLTYFKSLFLMMCLIQSVGNGVIAGEIGEGSAIAGFRHSAIMAVGTIVTFIVFIR